MVLPSFSSGIQSR
uniref:Uncharacterized protein n=1 Tax=Timema tahoe TaxID=61484 RepID=A0A7R9IUB7_9NEOP|nr:unnamed protein product [Timema tahoe]